MRVGEMAVVSVSVSREKKVKCKTDIERYVHVWNHIPFREVEGGKQDEEICTCRTFITDVHNTHIHGKSQKE